MWQKLDETIPVSASILIVVLFSAVVILGILLFEERGEINTPQIIYHCRDEVPAKSNDVEGTFKTDDGEEGAVSGEVSIL